MTRALLFDVNHSLFGSLETCDSPTIPFFFIFYSFVSVGMSCLASKDEWHLVNVFHLFKAETIFFLRSAIFPLFLISKVVPDPKADPDPLPLQALFTIVPFIYGTGYFLADIRVDSFERICFSV